jgi:hypothetical protein
MTELTQIHIVESAAHQPCAECGAPLDEQQRYCVVCGTSRRHPGDPLARYLALRRRPAAAAAAPAAAARRADGRWIALALALVPLAAGLGALVARGGGADQALLDALRSQKAPIVQVGAAAGGAPAGAAASAAGSRPGRASGAHGRRRPHAASAAAATSVRPPTARQKAAGAKIVNEIQAKKGKSYVDQQRNLPDTIVVP